MPAACRGEIASGMIPRRGSRSSEPHAGDVAREVHFVASVRPARIFRPVAVRRYLCLPLRGLSGMVRFQKVQRNVPLDRPLEVAVPGGVAARQEKLRAGGWLFRTHPEDCNFPVLESSPVGLGLVFSDRFLGLIVSFRLVYLGLLDAHPALPTARRRRFPCYSVPPVSEGRRHPVLGHADDQLGTPWSRQRSRMHLLPEPKYSTTSMR